MGNSASGVTPIVGISDLTLIKVLTDTRAEFTTDDENMIDMRDKIVSRAYAPQSSEGKFYAANKLAVNFKSNKGGNLTFVISDLTPSERQAILGNSKSSEGVTIATGDDVPPEYVVAYRIKKTKDIWELQKFAKVVFATPSENAQTEGENPEAQTSELVGTIVPLNYEVKMPDNKKKNGAFEFLIDSKDTNFSTLEADWFTKGTAGIVAKESAE